MSGAIITPAVRDALDKLLAILDREPRLAVSLGRLMGKWAVQLDCNDGRGGSWYCENTSLLAALEDVRAQWEASR